MQWQWHMVEFFLCSFTDFLVNPLWASRFSSPNELLPFSTEGVHKTLNFSKCVELHPWGGAAPEPLSGEAQLEWLRELCHSPAVQKLNSVGFSALSCHKSAAYLWEELWGNQSSWMKLESILHPLLFGNAASHYLYKCDGERRGHWDYKVQFQAGECQNSNFPFSSSAQCSQLVCLTFTSDKWAENCPAQEIIPAFMGWNYECAHRK